MNIDIIGILIRFIVDVYHSGGPILRWLVWIWVAFLYTYVLLGRYERINSKILLEKRTKEKKNYYHSLHAWGIITIILQYGYELFELPLNFPMAINNNSPLALIIIGFFCLTVGFSFVVRGRLYLNGFWGTHIYKYDETDDSEVKYRLIQIGPYKLCRHPIYFGQSLMVLGTAFVVNNWLQLIASIALVLFNIFRAMREEKFLKENFEEEWTTYKDKVSFFIPFL